MDRLPVVGVVGVRGAYGRWLAQLFRRHYGIEVRGVDAGAGGRADAGSSAPADPYADPYADTAAARAALVADCDVLWFATPIAVTPQLIRDYAALLPPGREPPLWLDVASLKRDSCAALAAAPVEAVGLHPMCAPPPVSDLRGRVLVVCELRLNRWRAWFADLLNRLAPRVVHLEPGRHDALMALVQAGVHAGWLSQARLWAEAAPALGGLDDLLAVRTPSFALAEAATARLLAGNAALYADIQLQNPQTPKVLRTLAAAMQELAATVEAGDREALIAHFLQQPRATLGDAALAPGNAAFERLSHLLADLDEPHPLLIAITADRPGTLAEVLAAFAAAAINLRAIQSVRDASGGIRFHLCLDRDADDPQVQAVCARLRAAGVIG